MVRQDIARARFELDAEGETAFALYRLDGKVMTIHHTEVPPHLRNRGIASQLIEGALGAARAQGFKVVPRCPFVKAFIARHPEFRDLLA